ncbi:MAG: redoxin domain-containing protein [Phycisphaeraceae bacterium]|nr:redoxin domain-containing protein [Phycisphaeraceae bacterium]
MPSLNRFALISILASTAGLAAFAPDAPVPRPPTPGSSSPAPTGPANPAETAAPKPGKSSGAGAIITSTGVLERAKKVGDTAPDFALPDAQGGTFELKAALAKGPVVLTWFRGEWCPFCNKQLVGLQERLPDFEAAGATVVAISPQTMEHSEATITKDSVKFHMLSDEGFKVGELYGVKYQMPEAMKEQLKKYKLDLSKYNGGEGDVLPLTASYVIDPQGVIQYAFIEADYTKRASPDDLLAAVKKINEAKK